MVNLLYEFKFIEHLSKISIFEIYLLTVCNFTNFKTWGFFLNIRLKKVDVKHNVSYIRDLYWKKYSQINAYI